MARKKFAWIYFDDGADNLVIEKGLCSIGRTKTKSGRAETDKLKLNRKRVINYPRKWRQNVSKQNKEMIFIYFT